MGAAMRERWLPRESGGLTVLKRDTHGTRSCYVVAGCRCDLCTRANTDYLRAQKKRRNERPRVCLCGTVECPVASAELVASWITNGVMGSA